MELFWDTVPWATPLCRYIGFEKNRQVSKPYLKLFRTKGAQTDPAKTANWWSGPARCCWRLLKTRAIISRQITLKIILPQESSWQPTNVNCCQTSVERRGLWRSWKRHRPEWRQRLAPANTAIKCSRPKGAKLKWFSVWKCSLLCADWQAGTGPAWETWTSAAKSIRMSLHHRVDLDIQDTSSFHHPKPSESLWNAWVCSAYKESFILQKITIYIYFFFLILQITYVLKTSPELALFGTSSAPLLDAQSTVNQ